MQIKNDTSNRILEDIIDNSISLYIFKKTSYKFLFLKKKLVISLFFSLHLNHIGTELSNLINDEFTNTRAPSALNDLILNPIVDFIEGTLSIIIKHPFSLKEITIKDNQNNIRLTQEEHKDQEWHLIYFKLSLLLHKLSSILSGKINILSNFTIN